MGAIKNRTTAFAWPWLGALVLFCALFWGIFRYQPLEVTYSTLILDKAGQLLGASLAQDGQWRFPHGGLIPDRYKTALMVFEDHRFLQHFGFDAAAIVRAFLQNWEKGTTFSGGSTLTMQVVRLSRPGASRSWGEKVFEAFSALHLELLMDKDQILTLYAESAPFGGNVVGLEAACWRWFGRGPDRLSWAEAALLAVLPNSPGLLHLSRGRSALKLKRDRLLQRLTDLGHLDQRTLELAQSEPLPSEPLALPRLAPHLLEQYRLSHPAGGRWKTALDADLQKQLLETLDRHQNLHRGVGIHNGALLILHNPTGEVVAYLGNSTQENLTARSAQVDIVRAQRSTGSLLKPFLYGAAAEAGILIPGQLVADIPTRIGSYIPQNNLKNYQGAVSSQQALSRSLNIPAVRLLRDYGIDRFLRNLRSWGMTTLKRSADDYGLTLIIGGGEGSLWEMTHLYADLARRISDSAAPLLLAPDPQSEFLTPETAWTLMEALSESLRPEEEGPWRQYLGSRRIAWKTGTSQGWKDAWTIGMTRDYTVGVWMGNASGEARPELKGFTVAAPLLFDAFRHLPSSPWFVQPDGLVSLRVCSQSGYLAGPHCAATETRLLPGASARGQVCPYCQTIATDLGGQLRVDTSTTPLGQIQNQKWFVLPPALEYYYRKSHLDYRPLPPLHPGLPGRQESMAVFFPEEGSQIFVPIELDGTPGEVIFQASHRDPRSEIFWHLDGVYLGKTDSFHQWSLRPAPGTHQLTLVDSKGQELKRGFRVLSE